jgi:hypothetical protein
MSRVKKTVMVRKLLETNPAISALELSKKLGTTKSYAYKLLANAKNEVKVEDVIEEKVTQEGEIPPEVLSQLVYDISQRKAKIRMMQGGEEKETVNHPPHYKVGGIETIDFIEAKGLDYCLGNVVKYITRADHKGNKIEDLRKAQWYLTRAISKI